MILGIEIGRYFYAIWSGLVIFCHVNRQDACKTNLEVDASILIEMVVPNILWNQRKIKYLDEIIFKHRGFGVVWLTVICERANHTDHQSPFSHSMRPSIGTIIGVLPKYTSILFVYADDILEFDSTTIMCNKTTRLCVMTLWFSFLRDGQLNDIARTR